MNIFKPFKDSIVSTISGTKKDSSDNDRAKESPYKNTSSSGSRYQHKLKGDGVGPEMDSRDGRLPISTSHYASRFAQIDPNTGAKASDHRHMDMVMESGRVHKPYKPGAQAGENGSDGTSDDSQHGAIISESKDALDERSTLLEKKDDNKEHSSRPRTRSLYQRDYTNTIDYQDTLYRQKRDLERTVNDQSVAIEKRDMKIGELIRELEAAANRQWEAENRANHFQNAFHEASQGAKKSHGEVQQLQHRAEAAESQMEKMQELLKVRTDELSVAQRFMTTADKASVADISHLVEQLNDDIYQYAAFLSDIVLQAKESSEATQGKVRGGGTRNDVEERYAGCRNTVVAVWGEEMVIRLQAYVEKEDTLLFEGMVQAAFVGWCHDYITSMYLENQRTDKHLRSLWKGISRTHEPSIAKNWLAMTYSEVKDQKFGFSSKINYLQALLSVAGWRERSLSEEKKVGRKLKEKLQALFATARKVKDLTIEGVLSAEIVTVVHPPKTVYNSSQMEDAYDTGKASAKSTKEGETIICTTGLGLEYSTMSGGRVSSESKVERKWEMTLKPKVLLASSLE